MMEEIWKPVKGYEGYYEVSNLGRLKSLYREEYLSPKGRKPYVRIKKEKMIVCTVFSNGYSVVSLHVNGHHKKVSVHRIVAETFIENTRNLKEIDHINTIRTDNRVENLRWVTRAENHLNPITRINHSKASKKEHKKPIKYVRNSDCKPKTTRSVIQLDLNYNFVASYNSLSEAERKTGVKIKFICMCCKNKMMSSHGFVWLYEEDYNNNNYIKRNLNTSTKRTYSKKVSQYSLDKKHIRDWDSISEASRTLGINCSHITQCCKGKTKQCGGFIWEYMCLAHSM